MLRWLLDPANAPLVGFISLAFGIIGTVITVFGLWFTFSEAKKARKEATDAKDAVDRFKFKVNNHDANQDVARASYALDATRRHLKNLAWRDAADSYEDARRAMIRLATTLSTNMPDEALKLNGTATKIGRFCNKIECALLEQGAYPDKLKAIVVIRSNYELLTSLSKKLSER